MCRPRGTRICFCAHPALKGGAIIFRPAGRGGSMDGESSVASVCISGGARGAVERGGRPVVPRGLGCFFRGSPRTSSWAKLSRPAPRDWGVDGESSGECLHFGQARGVVERGGRPVVPRGLGCFFRGSPRTSSWAKLSRPAARDWGVDGESSGEYLHFGQARGVVERGGRPVVPTGLGCFFHG